MKKEDKLAIAYVLVAVVFIFLYIVERQTYHLAIGTCFVCLAIIIKGKSKKGE